MFQILDLFIRIISYVGIVIGLWFMLVPFIIPMYKKRKVAQRFREMEKEENHKNKNKSKLYRQLELLLNVTVNNKSSYSVTTFLLISLVLLFITFIILFTRGIPFNSTLFISLFIGLLPYIILNLRLHSIRINSSYEGEELVTELINQYKINHLNMLEAIDRSIPYLKEQPHSRKALIRLSLGLKQYTSSSELEKLISEFTYAINTQWAMLLANNFYLSIEYGDDVKEALDDVLQEIRELKFINEKDKQFNNESFIMIKYVVPGSYFLSVYVMFSWFNFTIDKFIDYQLNNPLGFKMLLYMGILVVFNTIIYLVMRKPKNDF